MTVALIGLAVVVLIVLLCMLRIIAIDDPETLDHDTMLITDDTIPFELDE